MKDFKSVIELFIEDKISFETFEILWNDIYILHNLESNLDISDQDRLAEIHEKIEYTVTSPKEDREWGYIDSNELKDWLLKLDLSN